MKRNLVLLSLLVLVAAVSASAQTTYQITSTPTFVTNDARADVLGSVRITATTTATTVASSVQWLFINAPCDNDTTNGIGAGLPGFLFKSGAFAASATTAITSVSNSGGGGCIVTVNIPGGITPGIGDFVEVQGVRGRIDLSPAFVSGTDLNASLNATPSSASLFLAPTVVRVATSQPGVKVTFASITQLLCLALNHAGPITIKEGYPGSFVQNVVSAAGTGIPAGARPLFGATNNTQIRIIVVPAAGVTLSWPASVLNTGGSPSGTPASHLERITTATATTQIYEFTTPNQGTSDLNVESFLISPTITTVPATPPTPSNTTAAVQLFPTLFVGDATLVTDAPFGAATGAAKPRFNDPLTAATTINIVAPCTTNLLFTFVANTPPSGGVGGFDTGLAIANTSSDPYGTTKQAGTCTLNGFPRAGGAAVAFTTPSVAGGATFTTVLSSSSNPALNGFVGYIIAVCNFQYGHGFAFITNNFGVGAPNLAQGYIANVIPDPVILSGSFFGVPGSGRLAQTVSDFCGGFCGFAAAPPTGETLLQ